MKAKPMPGIPSGGPVPHHIAIPSAATLEQANIVASTCSHWVTYKGRKPALVAAGILADGWFPGDPGRNKTLIGFRKLRGLYGSVWDSRDPGALDQVRRCGRDLFKVMRETTDEEKSEYEAITARMDEERKRALEQRQALDRAEALEKSQLSLLIRDEQQFRDYFDRAVQDVWVMAHRGDGYSFDEDALDEIRERLQELRAVIERGRVTFSAAERADVVSRIRAQTAKSDSSLQTLLKSAATLASVGAATDQESRHGDC